MKNIEKLCEFLADHIKDSQIVCKQDLSTGTAIQFIDDQFTILPGAVWICSAKHLKARLRTLNFLDNCILFVSETVRPGFCRLAGLNNVTIVETDLGTPKLYNILSSALASLPGEEHPDDGRTPEEDQIAKLRRFWENLRSEKLVNDVEIREALGLAGIAAGKYVRVTILSMDAENADYKRLVELEEKLRAAMAPCAIIPDGTTGRQEFIILKFYDEQNFAADMNRPELTQLLEEEKCRIAFGNSTRHYDMINSQYLSIKRTLELAKTIGLNPEERAFHFDRYSVYYIIDLCAQSYVKKFKNTDILRLINPIIVHITRYDTSHNTNLRDVLFNYLANNRSLQATADVMHMHRNTVLNKLNTIKEISPIDFSDGSLCERLMLSCQIALYYEKVLKHQITA